MKTVGGRIRHIRKMLQLTQEQFARMLSAGGEPLTRGAVANWEYGKGISTENLEQIAIRTSVSMDWLSFGKGAPPTPLIDDVTTERTRYLDRDDPPQNGDVPNLNIHAGMGNGGLLEAYSDMSGFVASDFIDGFWSFPPMVRARLPNLSKIHAFPVVGDSMAPTLESGAIVFVDTTHIVPSPADIYALDYGDGLLIKRLELIPKSSQICIKSDNPLYRQSILERSDVRVFGRVVGYFRWRG